MSDVTVDIDSDVKVVRNDYQGAAWGQMIYKAQAPEGYAVVGGGAFAESDVYGRIAPDSQFQYDDGNIGWAAIMSIPQAGTWNVSVFAICKINQ